MGIDFNKLNPEEAQKIISALKDGRINDQEAKKLGLTAQEQEELNKAFSSGEVQIGDFVLINKGKSEDGKVQYSSTKKVEKEALQKEKTINIEMHDDSYYAAKRKEYNDKAADAKKDMAQAFSEGRIFDSIKALGKGLYAAYQKNNTPENAKEASIQQAGFGKWIIPAALAVYTLASCTPEDDVPMNISQNVELTLTQNSSLEEAIQALKDGQEVTNNLLAQILEREIQNGATLEEIKELAGENSWILTKLVDSMTENNQLLTDIRNSISTGTEDVLSAIISLQNSVDVLTALVADNPD